MNIHTNPRPKRQPAEMLMWQVCDDDAIWEATLRAVMSSPLEATEHTRPNRRWRGWLPLVCLLLFVAVGGSWWAWRRAAAGVAAVEAELKCALETDVWQQTNCGGAADATMANRVTAATLVNDPGASIGQVEVRELGKDWAVVEVTLHATDSSTTYRQTLAYREMPFGWVRDQPSNAHWGRVRQIESQSFVFTYYAMDDTAVRQAAPQVDALYRDLGALFGATVPPVDKLAFTVSPTHTPGIEAVLAHPDVGMIVPSPAARLLPTDLAPHEVLVQAAALAIYDYMAAESLRTDWKGPNWFRINKALRLWFIWQHDLSLAQWQVPLVQWILDDAASSDARGAHDNPSFARELCAHHSWWTAWPLDLGVPIVCDQNRNGEVYTAAWRDHRRVQELSISPLFYASVVGIEDDPGNIRAPYDSQLPEPGPHGILLATVFEFVAARNGAAMIPRLLDAIPQHHHADTLIPAVFGTSLAEFEQEWRAFLVVRYGSTP